MKLYFFLAFFFFLGFSAYESESDSDELLSFVSRFFAANSKPLSTKFMKFLFFVLFYMTICSKTISTPLFLIFSTSSPQFTTFASCNGRDMRSTGSPSICEIISWPDTTSPKTTWTLKNVYIQIWRESSEIVFDNPCILCCYLLVEMRRWLCCTTTTKYD